MQASDPIKRTTPSTTSPHMRSPQPLAAEFELDGRLPDLHAEIERCCVALFERWCESRCIVPLAYLMHVWPIPAPNPRLVCRLSTTLSALSRAHADALDPVDHQLIRQAIAAIDVSLQPCARTPGLRPRSQQCPQIHQYTAASSGATLASRPRRCSPPSACAGASCARTASTGFAPVHSAATGVSRPRTAIRRLLAVYNPDEHFVATRWVNAWSSAIGARRFPPLESQQFAEAWRPSPHLSSARCDS
jgi:hypothetical protein